MSDKSIKKQKEVSIIIPNYNGEHLLVKNLPEVVRCLKNKKNRILEIIVVDDASSDESVKIIKSNFPSIKLIKHKINRGFSASINTGARAAKGKFLALLNSDVVPYEDFLIKALPHFTGKKVFAVSFNEQVFGPAVGFFKNGFVGHKSLSARKTQESFWANGGSGIFRRSYWMKLNGMDEKLLSPFYWEDVDLSYRAQKRGWKIFWEFGSRVTHNHESTIGKINQSYRNKIQQRNELIFIWKNITSPILFRKHLTGLFRRLVKHRGYMKVLFMVLPKMRLIIKARKKEAKQAKVSDEAIFAKFS
jgi:GT2 family glycosyltransferase